MPVTEIVFPVFKSDPESVATLKENQSDIFQNFSGVRGLEAAFYGHILEENSTPVDPNNMRKILILDWINTEAFHDFYPKSDKFLAFISAVKPFAAGPATPHVYEASERSISCTSSNITQVITTKSGSYTPEAWNQLKKALENLTSIPPVFHHAQGTENDDEEFLGLIGWKDLQEYERVGKDGKVLKHIEELNKSGEVQNIIVQLSKLSDDPKSTILVRE